MSAKKGFWYMAITLFVCCILIEGALSGTQAASGVQVSGNVIYKNGNTFEFDCVAQYGDLSGSNFRFVDESYLTGEDRDALSGGGHIKLADIKEIIIGDVFETTKKFFYSGNPKGKQWKETQCKFLKVTVITRANKTFKDLLLCIRGEWSCGIIESSAKLAFGNSGLTRKITLSSLIKIVFN